jgi:hypothetical protein
MQETIELQNQIEADKFDLQDRDFKRGYPKSLRIKSLPNH